MWSNRRRKEGKQQVRHELTELRQAGSQPRRALKVGKGQKRKTWLNRPIYYKYIYLVAKAGSFRITSGRKKWVQTARLRQNLTRMHRHLGEWSEHQYLNRNGTIATCSSIIFGVNTRAQRERWSSRMAFWPLGTAAYRHAAHITVWRRYYHVSRVITKCTRTLFLWWDLLCGDSGAVKYKHIKFMVKLWANGGLLARWVGTEEHSGGHLVSSC